VSRVVSPRGPGKKRPPAMCAAEFAALFAQVSKAALIDALWCACQLGTDETREQITAKAAREVIIALDARGDRHPRGLDDWAKTRIDSDVDDD
jgi:hypothetical protein